MKRIIRIAVFGLLTLLSSCNVVDPYSRPYVWRPIGVYEANLAAMAVNPADLVRGRGTNQADGQIAAAAVDRLRSGHVKPLEGGDNGSTPPAGAAGLTAN